MSPNVPIDRNTLPRNQSKAEPPVKKSASASNPGNIRRLSMVVPVTGGSIGSPVIVWFERPREMGS
jgi:hypothetical protein